MSTDYRYRIEPPAGMSRLALLCAAHSAGVSISHESYQEAQWAMQQIPVQGLTWSLVAPDGRVICAGKVRSHTYTSVLASEPCPSCGRFVRVEHGLGRRNYWCACENCFDCGGPDEGCSPHASGDTAQEAADAWDEQLRDSGEALVFVPMEVPFACAIRMSRNVQLLRSI